ncbi:hypothetical protein [Paraglaciecola polaris]|uniref:Uncharacterized protein n=1 Tax=Paraglaciecola polaris LMG 21857 TaxID=1129793 RepID=K6YRD0_9ALTE|nr:hypothetical protein [Paraglaciecola polaris]GAC35279.1 hypothetical protein GPLA_4400 [Paraglaciecola polaris LMG 21857]|tara:strand:- start:5341 stop:5934 length:594 start_codon:yes stop_codon:yes gene_type:complete
MLGSAHIQLTNTLGQDVARTARPTVGSAHVLQQLLPTLWVNEPRMRYQPITGLDYYIREETEHLLARIETHCEMVLEAAGANAGDKAMPKFTLRFANGECVLAGQYPPALLTQLKQDRWLMDAFAWLVPNYFALVHSLELVAFSHVYQRSRSKASKTYRHFDGENNGLYVSIKFDTGKAQWNIASPINVFHLQATKK